MLPQHPVNIMELFCECFKNDFSQEQRSSLRMIYGSKHVGAILSVLMWNFIKCICWLIIKVILRNARCNNKDRPSFIVRPITREKCVEDVTLENVMSRGAEGIQILKQ